MMKHDLFEFNMENMTPSERTVRILSLVAAIIVLALDLFYWRPL